ncbi:molybdopterin cofactor-binding domain-containing protein [Flavobacterium sp. MC2016-06]|uniref:molybdopterin cofactor-binding domain-containing protein n=1 Tax=Flavobacterium sp. MC2016-06 TaxID=2676308 RepID=UPI0012BAC566|nr:molybdopterin cofactor-binding domain-containing protein [Flavobacterium sp. MC2016-06]MBU3857728.1 molybdopterin-dependent oxidoreductase [Flavobacterium sp. MC2016-06]
MPQTINTDFSRRNFLKIAGLGGTALCLGLSFISEANAEIIKPHNVSANSFEMNPWIIIETSGKVTIVNHRSEMGQGSYQSVPQIVAEELEVDLENINVIFAQGNKEKYGNQITGGSSTIRGSYKNLLKLSATAREMLITAAATKWGVSNDVCYASSGHVYHKPTGKKFHYGELVEDANKLAAPKEVKLKKRSEYRLIGKPLHRKDSPMKTDGSLIFGLDKRVEGMLFAAVERNPRLRGKVKSFDDSEARKIKGVRDVFTITMKVHNTNREGIAVVADTTWAALEGKKALKIVWDDSGFEHISTADIYTRQLDLLQKEEGLSFKKIGDPDSVLKDKNNKLDVVYQTPYQSHFAMEPINCVAHYQDNKIEIWGPIQAPDWIRDAISADFKMPKENVIVNMTFLGGGFGRKAFTDYPNEAVAISKKIKAPVQVVWSREDDATQGPFRPGITYRAEGTVENGAITVAKFRMAGQNIGHWQSEERGKPNGSTTEGFLAPYFDSIKNISFSDIPFETPIPVLWWRSVYASTNGFAFESFIDELAHQAGKDALEFRKEHLKEERVQNLLDKAAEVSGWKSRKKNEGFGLAITECFKTTVAQVVKVSKNAEGGVKIDKVWAVMDCGWYVNPDIIHAQVEGSIIMALGAATMHEQTFTNGMADKQNFYNYIMPRIYDIPLIEVHIMENGEDAGGVGEPALPPFAPALTNAIFDLTGKRIRKLPFALSEV